jgi:hypothetical protein
VPVSFLVEVMEQLCSAAQDGHRGRLVGLSQTVIEVGSVNPFEYFSDNAGVMLGSLDRSIESTNSFANDPF